MTAPADNQADALGRIPRLVREFFQAGGALAQAGARGGFPFEIRPQQIAMAEAVARAALAPAHLAVEAGTGVGKTFAYLAPLILLAVEQDQPVAVSTHTINLQEQIMFKDLPFLRQHLGVDFTAALCKGRQNYLCLRRLARACQMSGDLFPRARERELERVRRWAETTEDGSLSDFNGAGGEEPAADVWGQVCSEHDNCLGRQCPHGGRCFLMQARGRAFAADVLILNHHLFFSDLALKQEGAALLPECGTVVLDEAHGLEDVASEHFGLRLSQAGFEHWLRRLYLPESGKGLLAALKESELAHAVGGLWDDLERFFQEIRRWANLEGPVARRVVGAPLDLAPFFGARLTAALGQIERRARSLEDPEIKAEMNAILRRGREMRDSLDMFLTQSQANHVYWIEREGVRRKQLVLYSAPIEVGTILETTLFRQFRSVILTSATLAVAGGTEDGRRTADDGRSKAECRQETEDGGQQSAIRNPAQRGTSPRSAILPALNVERRTKNAGQKTKNEEQRTDNASPLAYFRRRVGAAPCRELVVGSPFQYSRQMRVYIAGDMPDPSREAAYTAAAAGAVAHFVRQSRGRAFVLFTSAAMMKTVAAGLRASLEGAGWLLIVQGEGTPRHRMLAEFKQHGAAVLFGLSSFWMGVDVPGAALSNVIIVRLPFAVPDEPVTKARMERIAGQGGDPFRDYSLPEAILKFRQGVGRLIRTATDEGMIAVLDPRIVSRWYGRYFLAAIPECPVEIVALKHELPGEGWM